ncbi:non-hydrolyzing UDP-N-acetylglucosamine 2-epimerase [Deferrisoma camini]|uniref:non-hydrolyzing UDP-N-acetylglucosamine 2-epimerase n=1 Tax=Deferrisoma camini TaxID=1035120 RepID=UPI00046D21CA|nr:UDP-N-acetylglucosamine 2-epimerase (non-hydrolyzing) [Deferrisoma camini]
MKILLVVGARPNFMKIAPIVRAIRAWNGAHPDRSIEHRLVHTGQHYDERMYKAFFEDLQIPPPDVDLEVGSGSHTFQTAHVMLRFEKVCEAERPDWVLVVGDVNSTMAASLVAVKMGIRVCHVEAGLRSRDRTMPEEINRLVTDAVADLLFTTSRDADENLKAEGVPPEKIRFVGNVMIDTLLAQVRRLSDLGLRPLVAPGQRYGVLTLHRPSNVDRREVLTRLLGAIEEVARDLPIVFPIHPRTRKMAREFGIDSGFRPLPEPEGRLDPGLYVTEPLGYLDFLNLWKDAALVLTDSGGLQEETTALGIPCLTLRENTERPVTIWEGTNTLVGTDPEAIQAEARKALDGRGKAGRVPELWDGRAAERIVAALMEEGPEG